LNARSEFDILAMVVGNKAEPGFRNASHGTKPKSA
jgi:hypothetical protein